MVFKIDMFDVEGNKLEDRSLSEDVFSEENVNYSLIHEFLVMQEANARHPIVHTKTRSEIRTAGSKLYRQKGTGRARVGDASSPIRKGGGIAFGPRNEVNYKKSMPKKMRRKALYGVLSLKARDGEILGLNEFPYQEAKTKNAVSALEKMGLNNNKILVVFPELGDVYVKSFRNLSNVRYVKVDYLNPKDLLSCDYVVFLSESLDKLENVK